jgi:hypothetical protein
MFINSAIQKYPSFELSFDLKIASGWGGDFFSVFFGFLSTIFWVIYLKSKGRSRW